MHRSAIEPACLLARGAPCRPALLDLQPPRDDVLLEVVTGLSSRPATLPCKLFYDEAGSRLFDQITRLPEYYPTRTELSILRACAPELANLLGHEVTLIEYGSGSSTKTRLLLEALDVRTYVPIDISHWYLSTAAQRLQGQFPWLTIRPIVADYTQAIQVTAHASERLVGFFPGSTIGNFEPADAVAFLRRVARTLGRGGQLVIGVDLKKDPQRLHAAYNDASGVTAAFNLNLLSRLNRELGADFDPVAWHHYAPFNVARGRIEMHLVAVRDQVVTIAGHRFAFTAGESIHTENSHKYHLRDFARLAGDAGLIVERVWTDPEHLFSVQLLRVA